MHKFQSLHFPKPRRYSRIERTTRQAIAIEIYLIASRFVASSSIAKDFVAKKIIDFYGNIRHSVQCVI